MDIRQYAYELMNLTKQIQKIPLQVDEFMQVEDWGSSCSLRLNNKDAVSKGSTAWELSTVRKFAGLCALRGN